MSSFSLRGVLQCQTLCHNLKQQAAEEGPRRQSLKFKNSLLLAHWQGDEAQDN